MVTKRIPSSSAARAKAKAAPARARAARAPKAATRKPGPARHEPPPAPLGSAGNAAKDGIERSLKALQTMETEVAAIVRQAIAGTLPSPSTLKETLVVVGDVVAGAIQACERVGTSLSISIRGVARGVVMGAHDVHADVTKAASETVKLAVKHAGTVRADVDMVVRHALQGVREALVETGSDVARIASVVAAAAARAVRRNGRLAVSSVGEALENVADGMKRVRPAAPAHRPRAAHRS